MSLIELVVVLFVMSVVSTMAVPLIVRRRQPEDDQTASTVKALREARRKALKNGRREVLSLHGTTVIFYPDGNALADTIRISGSAKTIVVNQWTGDVQVQ